ncbi:MAG: right-handed parallel beta-helix repeat-containing protein [bacterium]
MNARSYRGMASGRDGLVALVTIGLTVTVIACSNESGGGGGNNNYNGNTNFADCPEGCELSNTACLPVFDDCPAADEIPVLGGGCKPVGVPNCEEGPGCSTGFTDDGVGGCEPTLPAADCGDGSLAVLGNAACETIRDCGTGTWGNITLDASTIFVDGSYGGGGSDGSQGAPYVTLTAALAVASAGDRIALAEGVYQESVSLGDAIAIEGRCPELVTLQGISGGGNDSPPVTIQTTAAGAAVRGVRLESSASGVVLNEVADVELTDLEIADTGLYGVLMQRGSSAVLTRVKIAGAGSAGVMLYGGAVELNQCVVRGTVPAPDGSLGRGVDAGCDYFGTGGCPDLAVHASVISGNREAGILISGGSVVISDSLIRDTRANQNNGLAGIGVQAQCDTSASDCPTLAITGSVVTGNRSAGVMALGESTVIQDTVISNTLPQDGDQRLGNGLVAQCDTSLGVCGDITISCSTVDGNRAAGITLSGLNAFVESTIIRGTLAQQSDNLGGEGLLLQCEYFSRECTDASIVDTKIVQNSLTGVFLYGATVGFRGVYVAETQPEAAADEEGMGLLAQCDDSIPSCPELFIDGSLFESNYSEGLTMFGGTAVVERSSVIDVMAQASDGEFGFGMYIDGRTESELPTLDISNCEIRDAVVTGVFFVTAGGSVSRSRITGGDYSVILDASPDVVMGSGNELEGIERDEPLIQE